MARQRFIHPSIWNSDQFCSLSSDTARLLFIGIISTADDEGRRKASARSVKGDIFPQDSRELPDIEGALRELSELGLIRIYRIGEDDYLDLPAWSKYQKPRYTVSSKLPQYSEDSAELPTYSGNLPKACGPGSGSGSGKGSGKGTTFAPSPKSPPKERNHTPLSEQKGLVGEMAKLWKSQYSTSPTWTKEMIVALHSKRRANAELKDSFFVEAFKVYLEDGWWRTQAHPLEGFTKHLDKWTGQLVPESSDYQEVAHDVS